MIEKNDQELIDKITEQVNEKWSKNYRKNQRKMIEKIIEKVNEKWSKKSTKNDHQNDRKMIEQMNEKWSKKWSKNNSKNDKWSNSGRKMLIHRKVGRIMNIENGFLTTKFPRFFYGDRNLG